MERGHLTPRKEPIPGMPKPPDMPAWFRFYLRGLGEAEARQLVRWLDQEYLAATKMCEALEEPRQPQASAKIQKEGRRRG